jgi:surface carbohydrate biosynthesis protein (TIGR04326 family)
VSIEPMALVIVDSGNPVVDRAALATLGAGAVTVLSFTQSQGTVAAAVAALSSSGHVSIESGAPSVDEVAPEVAERFLELLTHVPRGFKLREKPLTHAWASGNGASLWWLHELSGRRSDIYPLFTRLCQLEVARRAILRTGATQVTLVSSDRAFSDVVASLCGVVGIGYRRTGAEKPNDGMSYRGILTRLALWSGRTLAQTFLAKLLTPNTKPVRTLPDESPSPICCFHTLYPSFFISTDGVMDEKFHRVPNLTASHGVTPFLAVTFAADDGHQHMTMGAYRKACLMLRRKPNFNDVPARLVDRDLPWAGLFVGLVKGASAALKNAGLERNSEFRDQWRLGDLDIFPLIRPELRMAVYRTPRYLMHLRRMQASIDAIAPDAVISALFEFPYGRATSMAIAASRTKPLNIGAQHGPTGRKLMYRFAAGELSPSGEGRGPQHVPMPDHLILESEEARTVLNASGYPLERLHVLGAPRLDALAEAPRGGGPTAPASRPIRILVIFGGTDGGQIMGTIRPVLNSAEHYHFILKPHPRSSVQAEQIERFLSVGQTGSRGSTYEIASGDIYDLMAGADAVVTTYSSAGMEAAALGYPVVTLNLPDFASPSGLMDMTGNVRFAASPEALKEALLDVPDVASEQGVAGGGEIERAFFSRLDGQAQTRWAETIARLTREHSAS